MAESLSINELAAIQAAKYVNDFWDNHLQSTSVRRMRLLDWYKQYRGIPNRRSYPGRANVFVNETLEAVESIVAQEIRAVFAEPRYLMMAGREPTDKITSEILEGAMFYYLDKMGWKSKLSRTARQKVKYGTCYVETCWESETGYQPKRVAGQPLPEINKTRLKDHPNVKYIDELDIALDHGKPDIQEMTGVVIRQRATWDYIKKRERQKIYSSEQVAKVKKMGEPNSQKSYDYMGGRAQRLSTVGVNILQFDNKEYEILRYWGLVPRWWVDEGLDIESDEATEMVQGVIEVIHDGPCLRLQRNPFWHQEIPVAMCPHIPVDDEACGIGACEIAESLQQELNDKRNQLLDHATDQIQPPLIENRAAGIGEIRWESGFRIKSNLPGEQALKPMYPGGNPSEVVMMEGRCQQDIRNKTGATDAVQGISDNSEKTAFEVNQLQVRGSLRIGLSTLDFGEFIKRVYRQTYKNIQQFTDRDTIIRIVGPKGVKWETLTPEMVAIDMDVIPKIATDVDSRVITRNQMIQFATGIAPFYPRLNFQKLVHRIYELFGWEDADEIVPASPEEFDRGQLSAEEEMQVLYLGQRVNVSIYDNHPQKITAAIQFMSQFESQMSPQAIEAFKDYIRQHAHYAQAMQAMSAQVAPAMNPDSAQPGGAPSANGGKPTDRGATQTLRGVTSPAAAG